MLSALIFTALLLLTRPSAASSKRTPIASFPREFDFGIATAPAHVEDQLSDSWLEWGETGQIPFFKNTPFASERLRFWSDPEPELELMRGLGVNSMRMGVDWGRLMPHRPGDLKCDRYGRVLRTQPIVFHPCRNGVQDFEALDRYAEIISMARKAKKMKVILTLFHHSLPRWANDKKFGGWTNVDLPNYFVALVGDVVPKVKHLVDRYVILNEPAVFANLVYGIGMWPGRLKEGLDTTAYWNLGVIKGSVSKAFENMAEAHRRSYTVIHELDNVIAEEPMMKSEAAPAIVGIAHNVAWFVPVSPSFATKPVSNFLHFVSNKDFLKRVQHHLDFIGINYYGKEYVSLTSQGAVILKNTEYSESGRAVSPLGFYKLLKWIHETFNVQSKRERPLPILITENGISDSTDVLRPPYLIEHLLAIRRLMDEGVPISGYHFWTLSDNWEWADGYCPKFGLAEVDRNTPDFVRRLRDSYYLYKTIVETRVIYHDQRLEAWNTLKKHSTSSRARLREHPFCRASDGRSTVEVPTFRRIQPVDWRFDYRLELFSRWWWPFVKRVEGTVGRGRKDDSDPSYFKCDYTRKNKIDTRFTVTEAYACP